MSLVLKQQSGLTLIEAMVALVVISVGLLGVAALQISSIKQNSSAYWHSQAVIMAHDMADRIRAVPAPNTPVPGANLTSRSNYIGIDTENEYNQDCIANACNTEEIRIADATDWSTQLSNLPAGRGIIRSAIAGQIDVVVMWDDEGTGATGTECGNNPEQDLTCYTVTMSSL